MFFNFEDDKYSAVSLERLRREEDINKILDDIQEIQSLLEKLNIKGTFI